MTDLERKQPVPGQNNGVIEVMPKVTDFVAGAETAAALLQVVRSLACDWTESTPTDEKQLLVVAGNSYLETNACVTFSGDNVLEMQGDADIAMGATFSPDDVAWLKANGYFDENGKLNFSDRFTAKMSGTDPNGGNSLPKVWDSRRHDGMVPESRWPMPTAELQAWIAAGKPFTYKDVQDLYYAEIPADVVALGKAFAARFDVQYEWVKYPGYGDISTLRAALKNGPLQIATAVCTGWNSGDVPACGPGSQHATTLLRVDADNGFRIYDHYNPFVKRFEPGYDITYAMRGAFGTKAIAPAPAVTFAPFNAYLVYNVTGDTVETRRLQSALQALKRADGTTYMKVGVFGPFGPQTKTALGLFQTDHGIVDTPAQGEHFGPLTRAAFNAELKRQGLAK